MKLCQSCALSGVHHILLLSLNDSDWRGDWGIYYQLSHENQLRGRSVLVHGKETFKKIEDYFDVLYLGKDKRNAVMKYAPTINVCGMRGFRGGVYED